MRTDGQGGKLSTGGTGEEESEMPRGGHEAASSEAKADAV